MKLHTSTDIVIHEKLRTIWIIHWSPWHNNFHDWSILCSMLQDSVTKFWYHYYYAARHFLYYGITARWWNTIFCIMIIWTILKIRYKYFISQSTLLCSKWQKQVHLPTRCEALCLFTEPLVPLRREVGCGSAMVFVQKHCDMTWGYDTCGFLYRWLWWLSGET